MDICKVLDHDYPVKGKWSGAKKSYLQDKVLSIVVRTCKRCGHEKRSLEG